MVIHLVCMRSLGLAPSSHLHVGAHGAYPEACMKASNGELTRKQAVVSGVFVLYALALLAVLFFVIPSQAQTGTITGKVRARGMRHHGDAVVYVEKIPGKTFAPPKEPVTLDQLNLTFIPHVLPVLVGTTVAFPNSDEVRHNVFSTSPAKRFNLGTYPQGVVKHVTFDTPGVVDLLCNVHSEMSAYVVVLETPYVAVTEKDGSYAIKNVPPGKYILKTWHEHLKPQTKEVEVIAGSSAQADFELRK